ADGADRKPVARLRKEVHKSGSDLRIAWRSYDMPQRHLETGAPRPSAARPWIAALVASALGAFGCATIAGVDFEAAKLRQTIGDPSLPDGHIGSIPTLPVGPDGKPIETSNGGTGCAPDQKMCNGACVKKSDPLFGCGGAACEPCSLPNA